MEIDHQINDVSISSYFFSLLEKIMIVLTGLIFGRIQYLGNWCTTEVMMRLCKYLASEDLSTRVNKNKLFW